MSYLFGSILTTDLYQMAGLCVGILFITLYYYNDFLAIFYDSEFAELRGVPVNGLHFLFIGMIAVSFVMIIRVVGLILIIALLTIPPYIAKQYSSSLFKMMLISSVLSLGFTLTGLWFSYSFKLTYVPKIPFSRTIFAISLYGKNTI